LSSRGYSELASYLNSCGRQPCEIRPDETWDDIENGIVPIGKLLNQQRLDNLRKLERVLVSCGTVLATRADRDIYPSRLYNSGNRPPVVYGKNDSKGLKWSSGWDPKKAEFVTGRLADFRKLRSLGYTCISVTGVIPTGEKMPVYSRFIPDAKLYDAYREATLDDNTFARSIRKNFATDYVNENLGGDPETDIWALCAVSGGSRIALVENEPLTDICPRRLCAGHIEKLGIKVPEYRDSKENGDMENFVDLVCYAFDGVEVLDLK
jgi:hypothetical protein